MCPIGNWHQYVASCQELLDLYTSDKEKFCCHLVTIDETWIHHCDPESTTESMRWKHVNCPPPKRFRTQTATGKSYDNNFGDSKELHMHLITYGRLLAFKEDNYWSILCRNYVYIVWHHQSETSRAIVIQCLASSRQCASSQVTCCTASCSRLCISSTEPPCLQSRSGS